MSRLNKELMDQVRAAQRLDPATLDRMASSFQKRLAHGDAPLSGIDASPVVLSKLSWLAELLAATATKIGLAVVGLTALGGVSLLAMRKTEVMAFSPGELDAPREVTPIWHGPLVPLLSQPVAETAEEAPEQAPKSRSVRQAHASDPHEPRDDAPNPAQDSEELGDTDQKARTEERAAAPEVHASRAPSGSNLEAELALVQGAYAEMNAGHLPEAFGLLDQHEARFSHGALEQARDVARMLALCAAGKPEAAKGRARAFLQQHPKSSFAARVRNVCDTPLTDRTAAEANARLSD
jgi:hypothetical protein